MTLVGNDVVDLRDPRCRDKARDDRFMDRVFTRAEAADIRAAADLDRRLWLAWAAKEAAFKVISKLLGSPPVFEHAAFRTRLTDEGTGARPARGVVHHQGTELPFLVEDAPDRIHLLAWYRKGGGPPGSITRGVRVFRQQGETESSDWRSSLRERFSEREWASVHAPASALVRLRARRALARLLEVEEGAVEIVCESGPPGRAPPRALLRGEPCRVDVSLSHHGRFLAWALAGPADDEEEGGSGAP